MTTIGVLDGLLDDMASFASTAAGADQTAR
jgi:hypothetical protein